MEIPYSFESEASKLVCKIRRQVEHVPTRFQMLRISDHIRQSEWEYSQAQTRKNTLARAKVKAAATRAHNADPFGFKAMREMMQ